MLKMPTRDLVGSSERTVPAWWRAVAEVNGTREAVRMNGHSTTYADLDRRSAALARGLLAAGAGKGTRIGLLAPNGPDWIVSWLAIERIGGICVALSTFFAGRELAYGLRHADVAFLLTAQGYLKHDYCQRLEEALPSLAGQDGESDLLLPECPYLRGVWIAGNASRKWARGTLADLEAAGSASSAYTPDFLARIEAAVSSADLAIMIYTSGSTADPKAVVHTQRTVMDKTLFLVTVDKIMPYGTDASSRVLTGTPSFWIGGFLSMSGALAVGATIICQDDRTPAALLEAVKAERATHVTGAEAGLRAMVAAPNYKPGDLDGLKPHNIMQLPFFNSDPELDGRLANSLGMTESFGPHCGEMDGLPLPPEKAYSFGHAFPPMELKVVHPETGEDLAPGEVGELCVRGDWLMDGFYKRDRRDVFDADGFYHTGDNCVIDAEGYLFFKGRLGGMIKTSGANVSPEEVEDILRMQPGVLDVAVFGVPHPKMDQMVVAVVAAREGAQLSEAGLQATLKGELSSFKVPKRILFMDFAELPRTPSNKVRKPALAELVAAKLAEPA